MKLINFHERFFLPFALICYSRGGRSEQRSFFTFLFTLTEHWLWPDDLVYKVSSSIPLAFLKDFHIWQRHTCWHNSDKALSTMQGLPSCWRAHTHTQGATPRYYQVVTTRRRRMKNAPLQISCSSYSVVYTIFHFQGVTRTRFPGEKTKVRLGAADK